MEVATTPSSDNTNSITSNDLEFWMTNLPQKLRTLPIIYLAIPGSHDSATYGITRNSKISPDAEDIIKSLKFLGPLLRLFMVGWSKTQTIDVTQQLKSGIRYFDLRIATQNGNDQFYFVHGLYSKDVNSVLEKINEFLDSHPGEVVILDCQHFYAFQQNDHERLMHLLNTLFGAKMVPYTPHMGHLSLHYMTTQFHYQVVTIYRSDAARFGQPLLWPSASFPTPWADTVSIPRLINFLDDELKQRNQSMGFISQCVLTPSSWFVFRHLFSSLKQQCLIPLEKEKYKWLRKQKPGRNGLNIVISDFVDDQEYKFTREVVGLNHKLMDYSTLEQKNDSLITPVDNSD